MGEKNETLESEMNTFTHLLTPTQVAKFIVWIKNNSACMTMLNQLWDKMDDDDNEEDKR